jgi:hypothetical protein
VTKEFEQLSLLMREALDKVRAGEYGTIAATLIPAIPECVRALERVIVSQDSSVAQRLEAIALLFAMHTKIMKADLHEQRLAIAREEQRAKAMVADAMRVKAKVDYKHLQRSDAAEAKRVGRRLAKIERELEKESQKENGGL